MASNASLNVVPGISGAFSPGVLMMSTTEGKSTAIALKEKDELIAKLLAELQAGNAEIKRLKEITTPTALPSVEPEKPLTARERERFEKLKKDNLDLLSQRAEALKRVEDMAIQIRKLEVRLSAYEKQTNP